MKKIGDASVERKKYDSETLWEILRELLLFSFETWMNRWRLAFDMGQHRERTNWFDAKWWSPAPPDSYGAELNVHVMNWKDIEKLLETNIIDSVPTEWAEPIGEDLMEGASIQVFVYYCKRKNVTMQTSYSRPKLFLFLPGFDDFLNVGSRQLPLAHGDSWCRQRKDSVQGAETPFPVG